MENERKINIKEYLKHYNDDKSMEGLLEDIENQLQQNHNNHTIIGDLNVENIYINNLGELNFNNKKENVSDFSDEILKDELKYRILLIAICTNNIENPSVKNKLRENSDVSIEDVAKFYRRVENKLPLFAKNKIRNNHGANKGHQKIYSTGKYSSEEEPIEENNLPFKPNAFITTVVFPFVFFYIVFMVALLYWMIVLS